MLYSGNPVVSESSCCRPCDSVQLEPLAAAVVVEIYIAICIST